MVGILKTLAALLCVLAVAAIAQDPKPGPVIPDDASATSTASQQLTAGQKFAFKLHFSPAPDNFGGGSINARFERIDGPSGEELNNSFWGTTSDVAGAGTTFQDKQADYTLSLGIGEAMPPGRWKLTSVTLGRSVQRSIPVHGTCTFEIPARLPVAVTVHAPQIATAGQDFIVTVKLESGWPDPNMGTFCTLALWVELQENPPNGRRIGMIGPDDLSPGTLSYRFVHSFEPDYPPGHWTGKVIVGTRTVDRNIHAGCRNPHVEGDQKFAFDVVPSGRLVIPASVAVSVSPSQVQMFRAESARLKQEVEQLRQQLRAGNKAEQRSSVRSAITGALANLDRTEIAFKGDNTAQANVKAVDAFFDDIRRTYNAALSPLTEKANGGNEGTARLLLVNAESRPNSSSLDPIVETAIASLVRNADGYDIAVDTKALTFSLTLYSHPDHATVTYKQTGEDDITLDHETDWHIDNLTRGRYTIKFTKAGYVDKEVQFDAMTSRETSLTVDLERRHGAK